MLSFINIIPRCGALKLTQGGAKGALKYDEWEKEDSGRIKMRLGMPIYKGILKLAYSALGALSQ
jgi:hypothetical protein